MFPNFLVIDVASVIERVQNMIEQVTHAIEFVFLFTLLAGFAVMYAAIASTQDERIYEAAIFGHSGPESSSLRVHGQWSLQCSGHWQVFLRQQGQVLSVT